MKNRLNELLSGFFYTCNFIMLQFINLNLQESKKK